MKKKLLAILVATAMSMALIACGGEEAATEEAVVETEEATVETEEVAGDYTEEQLAFLEEFSAMVDAYNAAVDVFNATPELAENQELVEVMNTVTEAIDETSKLCEDPSVLTEDNMELLRTTSFVETYKLIDEINAYAEGGSATEEMSGEEALKTLFTWAMSGADEEENTYWFLFDDDLTIGACVIMSADYTQSVNVLGTVSEDGDAMVITDEETGDYVKFNVVEEGEDYLVISFEEGNEVTVMGDDLDEVIETIIAIDENTEIIN